ncbi:toxin-antitoxin system TumE family protein [Dissulfurispira sp.]|uniref:toxin-antitoxin system TumE family protein n=1 Tax=Dissulfurispira sp. TaxID=2817609 RepID=UPI002FD9F9BB
MKAFVTEHVDLRYKIEKLTYSFHYQDKDGSMIFRYDNAKHKPDLGFDSHKHVKEKVLISEVPELRNILEEIMVTF